MFTDLTTEVDVEAIAIDEAARGGELPASEDTSLGEGE